MIVPVGADEQEELCQDAGGEQAPLVQNQTKIKQILKKLCLGAVTDKLINRDRTQYTLFIHSRMYDF